MNWLVQYRFCFVELALWPIILRIVDRVTITWWADLLLGLSLCMAVSALCEFARRRSTP